LGSFTWTRYPAGKSQDISLDPCGAWVYARSNKEAQPEACCENVMGVRSPAPGLARPRPPRPGYHTGRASASPLTPCFPQKDHSRPPRSSWLCPRPRALPRKRASRRGPLWRLGGRPAPPGTTGPAGQAQEAPSSRSKLPLEARPRMCEHSRNEGRAQPGTRPPNRASRGRTHSNPLRRPCTRRTLPRPGFLWGVGESAFGGFREGAPCMTNRAEGRAPLE
jgi:hypothetical protein